MTDLKNNTVLGIDHFVQSKAIHELEGVELSPYTKHLLLLVSTNKATKEEADKAFYHHVETGEKTL